MIGNTTMLLNSTVSQPAATDGAPQWMNMGGMVGMMLFSSLTALITPMITNVAAGGLKGIGKLIDWLEAFFIGKPSTLVITSTQRKVKGGHGEDVNKVDDDQACNIALIEAVLYFITQNSLSMESMEINMKDDGSGRGDNERWKTRTINTVPTTSMHHDGMAINYSKSTIDYVQDDDKKKGESGFGGLTFTLRITSRRKTTQQLRDFVQKCYTDYADAIVPKDERVMQYFYQLQKPKNVTNMIQTYQRYEIGYPDKEHAFDHVFIPQATLDNIRKLLDDLAAETIDKVVIMFSGIPGAGKTSLARAIAEYTGRDIVNPKISYIINDDMLMQVLFDYTIYSQFGFAALATSQRMFLFEDFDAETKVLHCRKRRKLLEARGVIKKEAPEEKQQICINMPGMGGSSPMVMNNNDKKHGITMAGWLNVFDGALRLRKALVVMSANHPELIDEAVKRHGRITLHVHLVEMMANDAHRMIRYHFNGETVSCNIPDGVIVPADLEALCQRCNNVDEMNVAIGELLESYRQKKERGAKAEDDVDEDFNNDSD
jgi:hypothetical protein